MSGIETRLKEILNIGEKALIVYLTCGDLSAQVTVDAALQMADAGADIVELGVPFNDPVADGPVIQDAMHRALLKGMNLKGVLKIAERIRSRSEVPIVLMSYYNPIYSYGTDSFCEDAAASGVNGLLIVDLPADEASEIKPLAEDKGLDTIFLLTPVSGPDRIELTLKHASGFLYFVSVTGVTGARDSLPPELTEQVKKVKSMTKLPVCVGFGISGPESAKAVAEFADGVVVGSAIVKAMQESSDPPEAAAKLTRSIKDALR